MCRWVPITASSPVVPTVGSRRSSTHERNRNLFTVAVPKDFGKKELVWTIVANGKTQRAYGWLQPEWEIDPAGGASLGGQQNDEARRNKAPTITVAAAAPIAVGATATLTATVADDGLPKPAPEKKAAVGQETPANPAGRRGRARERAVRGGAPTRPGARNPGSVSDQVGLARARCGRLRAGPRWSRRARRRRPWFSASRATTCSVRGPAIGC